MNIKNLIMGVINQNELLNYHNASLIFEKLPKIVKGFVYNYDNVYFVTINKNLSCNRVKDTILHELAHIELNQLCQLRDNLFAYCIEGYEDEANEYIRKIKEEIENENRF